MSETQKVVRRFPQTFEAHKIADLYDIYDEPFHVVLAALTEEEFHSSFIPTDDDSPLDTLTAVTLVNDAVTFALASERGIDPDELKITDEDRASTTNLLVGAYDLLTTRRTLRRMTDVIGGGK